jgi:hypothetical protein
MTDHLDHLVIATPDLDASKAAFLTRTSVAPTDGGPHVGLGTRNALVSFGDGHYLELIAPDPTQLLEGRFGGLLAQLPKERLLQWAIRTTDTATVAKRARAAGFAPAEPRRMSRARPDGRVLEWVILAIGGHDAGGVVPFFIDWLDCPHPADTSPVVGPLTEFIVTAPNGSALARLVEGVQGVVVGTGPAALRATFTSPKGPITYDATEPEGFRL